MVMCTLFRPAVITDQTTNTDPTSTTSKDMKSSTTSSTPSSKLREHAEMLAKGLYQVLEPVVVECDVRIQAVFKSQNELSNQIDTLTKELEHFSSISSSPGTALSGPVQTLVKAKQRLTSICATLSTIKERLDRMEKIASAEIAPSPSSKISSTSPLHNSSVTSGSTNSIPILSSLFGKSSKRQPGAQVLSSATAQSFSPKVSSESPYNMESIMPASSDSSSTATTTTTATSSTTASDSTVITSDISNVSTLGNGDIETVHNLRSMDVLSESTPSTDLKDGESEAGHQ